MNQYLPGGVDHPSWRTVLGTFVGYGAILLVMTVLLFAVPYLVFTAI
ncbi:MULTISPECIES: hypothetical protein [Halococcus]|uniref:ABC transporter permease n=1 Tax=Halococcus salifodinae DSM 8989 TaxID=1227456 RepID=M0N4C1_9EURY|nr:MULTISPECIES: hypothetical protein [Halococcus]EMA52731.1 hypothetical protein C450_09698 [Halococcus salifodinae DSM 8989]